MEEKKEAEKKRGFWKSIWFLVWKDDSFMGWILSLILLFVLIKFIFFPVLGLVTGTTLPLAIVESCSMYHQGNLFSDFSSWFTAHEQKYAQFSINESSFSGFTMKNGFNKGDIIFITWVKPGDVKIGDIIIYNSGTNPSPIIHRVVSIRMQNGSYVFSTIGDNNWEQFSIDQPSYVNPNRIDEINVSSSQVIGEARLKLVPYLGWVKLIFYDFGKPSSERGLCSQS